MGLRPEKRALCEAISASVICCAIAFLLFEPNFQTNDDVLLSSLLAGKLFVNTPNEFYWPSNVLFCLSIKSLYLLTSLFDWYSVAVYLMLSVGGASVYYSVRRLSAEPVIRAALVAHTLLFQTYLFIFPQFTNVAIASCGAAVVLAVSAALRPPQTRGVYRLQRLVASCLLVSGGLLRTDALFAIIILLLPTVVVFVIRKATMVKRVAGSLATATVVLLLAIIFDQAYYLILTGQEWSDFIRFRNAAVGLLDYDRLAHLTPSQLSQVGWTINDRLMMERWWLVDPMVYGEEKLRALASFSPSKAQGIIQRVLGGNLIPRLGWFPQEHLVAIALLAAMILTLFSRTTVLATLALLTGIWGELLLVDSMGRPAPWRVAFPIFSLALAGLLISTATRGVFARYQRLQCAGIGVLFVFYVGTSIFPGVTFEAGYRARMRGEVWDAFAKVEPEKDKLFVIYGGDFPFEIAVPPFTTHRISQDIKFYWSALPAQTPFGREMLQSFNVQDVLSDLAEREDLYLVSNPGNDELVQQAFWEHYNKEVVLSPVLEHPLLRVVKIRVRGKTP